jgi:hypothetical protein
VRHARRPGESRGSRELLRRLPERLRKKPKGKKRNRIRNRKKKRVLHLRKKTPPESILTRVKMRLPTVKKTANPLPVKAAIRFIARREKRKSPARRRRESPRRDLSSREKRSNQKQRLLENKKLPQFKL